VGTAINPLNYVMSNMTYNAIVKTVNYNASAAEKGGYHIPFAQFDEPFEVITDNGKEFAKRTAVIDSKLAKWISVRDITLIAKDLGFGIRETMTEIQSQKNEAEADARKTFSGKEVVIKATPGKENQWEFIVVGFASDAATATVAPKPRRSRKSNK